MSQANPSDEEIDIYAKEWLGNGNKIKAAWKVVFPSSKATEKSKDEKSSLFHNLGKVQSRIDFLSSVAAEIAAENHAVTVDSILEELEEARVVAKENSQSSAMVAASMGKAKLAGLDIDRLEVSGADMSPWSSIKGE